MSPQNPAPKLVLASSSPRRRDFLTALGLTFTIDCPDIDEQAISWKTPREYAMKTAFAKSGAVVERMPHGTVVIAADTIVAMENRIYSKPVDAADAVRILRELSGRTHQVMTGVAVAESGGAVQLQVVETSVRFRELSDAEIEVYVATGEPLDKAGAYGIQGLGGALVTETRGDWSNIVGLPLSALLDMLAQTSVPVGEARLKLKEMEQTRKL